MPIQLISIFPYIISTSYTANQSSQQPSHGLCLKWLQTCELCKFVCPTTPVCVVHSSKIKWDVLCATSSHIIGFDYNCLSNQDCFDIENGRICRFSMDGGELFSRIQDRGDQAFTERGIKAH